MPEKGLRGIREYIKKRIAEWEGTKKKLKPKEVLWQMNIKAELGVVDDMLEELEKEIEKIEMKW